MPSTPTSSLPTFHQQAVQQLQEYHPNQVPQQPLVDNTCQLPQQEAMTQQYPPDQMNPQPQTFQEPQLTPIQSLLHQNQPLQQPPDIQERTLSLLPPPAPTQTTCPAYPRIFCCPRLKFGAGQEPIETEYEHMLMMFIDATKYDMRTFPVLSRDLFRAIYVVQVSEQTNVTTVTDELVRRGYIRFFVPSSQSTGERFAEVQGGYRDLILLYRYTGVQVRVVCRDGRKSYVVKLRTRAFDDGSEDEKERELDGNEQGTEQLEGGTDESSGGPEP